MAYHPVRMNSPVVLDSIRAASKENPYVQTAKNVASAIIRSAVSGGIRCVFISGDRILPVFRFATYRRFLNLDFLEETKKGL